MSTNSYPSPVVAVELKDETSQPTYRRVIRMGGFLDIRNGTGSSGLRRSVTAAGVCQEYHRGHKYESHPRHGLHRALLS